jgi:hypothetical protein
MNSVVTRSAHGRKPHKAEKDSQDVVHRTLTQPTRGAPDRTTDRVARQARTYPCGQRPGVHCAGLETISNRKTTPTTTQLTFAKRESVTNVPVLVGSYRGLDPFHSTDVFEHSLRENVHPAIVSENLGGRITLQPSETVNFVRFLTGQI